MYIRDRRKRPRLEQRKSRHSGFGSRLGSAFGQGVMSVCGLTEEENRIPDELALPQSEDLGGAGGDYDTD